MVVAPIESGWARRRGEPGRTRISTVTDNFETQNGDDMIRLHSKTKNKPLYTSVLFSRWSRKYKSVVLSI